MRNEWMVPVAVGVLAVGLAWLFLGSSGGKDDAQEAGAPPPLILPFDRVLVDPDGASNPQPLLGVWLEPAAYPVGIAQPLGVQRTGGKDTPLLMTPQTPSIVFIATPAGNASAEFRYEAARLAAIDPAPAGPRFAVAGHDIVRTTIYVFRADGKLAYSNAGTDDVGRFEKGADYRHLPNLSWYLGNGTAPQGTLALPASVRPLFEPLQAGFVGLPVGGIATAALDSQTVRDVYGGPLYATARIDMLAKST